MRKRHLLASTATILSYSVRKSSRIVCNWNEWFDSRNASLVYIRVIFFFLYRLHQLADRMYFLLSRIFLIIEENMICVLLTDKPSIYTPIIQSVFAQLRASVSECLITNIEDPWYKPVYIKNMSQGSWSTFIPIAQLRWKMIIICFLKYPRFFLQY